MRGLERAAAGFSFAAGAIHAAAGPEHVKEWWVYGLFFYGSAVAQVGYGLLLVTQGIEGWGGWMAVRRWVYLAGVWGNLAIIALWVVTRTIGVPVGPEAFEPEGLGPLDLSSKAIEIVLVILLLVLYVKDRRASRSLMKGQQAG